MKVPFIDIKRYEDGFLDAVSAKFAAMLADAQFMGGAEVQRLEARLGELLDVKSVVTCANGTDALQLALRALNVGPDDTVLVPDVTFWATFEAVVNVGAMPATLDVELSDGGISVAALRRAIHDLKPKAAIIAHLYGWGSGRLAEIRTICRDEGVLLIEDGAQCLGAAYQGQPIYKGALISTASFYPAKVLGAAGDGGAIMTDDLELASRTRRLANHGRTAHYGYADVGWNSRLDSLQAAFLNLSLDHLDARLASRRRAAAYYQDVLPSLGIRIMMPPDAYVENGYCNVCMFDDPQKKTAVESALRHAEIGFGNIYPGVISDQQGARSYMCTHVGGVRVASFALRC
ncbi:DegT/DnrJ/EryC1/StrS family aminotransferase [Devosia algicola]|uniref:DegT/DnrJ/EryC1/StrS family aminotransferase n=1 Tax=Devosia algicola TaxID=3026418 RepID=A0ABY7YM13_9HYPH|nr:DegT/DnrJ/EryC1/StrS family aminotransferase [Devosia algicola]WDR02336.1 DegT/DnrJ/EryC1/StrS family aminotransferase [Devosia algicola]